MLRNQGVEYVKDVCLKHMKLLRLKIDDSCKFVAAKSLCKILNEHVSWSVKMTDSKAEKQRVIDLEVMMLVDPCVANVKKRQA